MKMKICFLLQRSFWRIGHALAVNLKNNFRVKEFCGYAHLRTTKEFLDSQKEIEYKPLILDEDIHKKYKEEKIDFEFLKRLEKDYGIPNLWPYLTIDRTLMYSILPREYPSDKPFYSHEEMLKILQVKARAIIAFLEKEKPNSLVLYQPGSTSNLLLFHIAKKMGIKTIVFYLPGIKNIYAITEDYNRLSYAEKTFEKIEKDIYNSPLKEKAQKWINEFRKTPQPYHPDASPGKNVLNRLEQMKFIFPKNFVKTTLWFIHLIFKKNKDYTDERPIWFLIDRMKRKFRTIVGYSDLYDEIEENEDFAFFPLSAEPELSLYLWAPFITNQIELAKHIARSLPAHFKLYVKEHPAMFGYRTRHYYKQLKKIPNVKLINPKIQGYDLIKKAKLITIITGTGGWEASILKKPVITFGNIFYNKLSMVKNCRCVDELPYLVKEQLENFQYNEQELINFLAAIMEESVEIDLIDLWYKEENLEKIKNDPGIQKLADLLAKKLGL